MITFTERRQAAEQALGRLEENIRQYQQAVAELSQRALMVRGRIEAYAELEAEEQVTRETETSADLTPPLAPPHDDSSNPVSPEGQEPGNAEQPA